MADPNAPAPSPLGQGTAPTGPPPTALPAPGPLSGYQEPGGGGQYQEPEVPLSDALGSLFSWKTPRTIAKGLGEMVQGFGEMAMHPVETAKTAAKLAASSPSIRPVVAGTLAAAQPFLSDEHKQQITEALKDIDAPGNAIGQMLKDRYGSYANIKKTMYDDPGGFLMDVGTLFTGGEALLGKAATMIPKATAAGRAAATTAEVLGKGAGYAKYVDPTNVAVKGLETLAERVGPKYMGLLSGVGDETMEGIRDLYKADPKAPPHPSGATPQVRQNEFIQALKGQVDADQVIDRAEQGLKNIRDKRGGDYAAAKTQWKQNAGAQSFADIDAMERKLVQESHTPGGIDLLDEAERKQVTKMQDIIEEVRRKGPTGWDIEELDALKRRIGKLTPGPLGNKEVQRIATGLNNSIRDTIYKYAPDYKNAMKDYHDASEMIEDIQRGFALERGSGKHTSMSKLQSVLRNNVATQYGTRQKLFDLLESEGNVSLKPYLLGMATHPLTPRGITRGVIGGILGTGMGAGVANTAAGLVGASPRIGANVSKLLGQYGDALTPAMSWFKQAPLTVERTLEHERENKARGGRVGYADGGEVSEDDALSVNPAVGRVRRSYFTPVGVTNPRVAASQAIFGKTPEALLPKLPSGGASSSAEGTTGSGVMGSIAGLWNAPFEQKRRQEETARKDEAAHLSKEAAELEKQKVAAGAQNKGTGSDTATAPGTTPGGGVLQGTPIPGDSYEAKVGSFESSGKDTAVNPTTGAAGRYQFAPSTAAGIIKANPHLNISENWRTNAEDQQKLMKVYTDTSREILRKQLGREPTGGELYALHLFGHGKGPTVVGAGNVPLVSVTSEAERSGNPFLNNFKTAADLVAYFNKRFG